MLWLENCERDDGEFVEIIGIGVVEGFIDGCEELLLEFFGIVVVVIGGNILFGKLSFVFNFWNLIVVVCIMEGKLVIEIY